MTDAGSTETITAPSATPNAAPSAPAPSLLCRHCHGSGREPLAPMPDVEFSRQGPSRGEQQRLAQRTGISPSMLSRVFSGEVEPRAFVLLKLAQCMGTTVDRILSIPAIRRRIQQGSSKP